MVGRILGARNSKSQTRNWDEGAERVAAPTTARQNGRTFHVRTTYIFRQCRMSAGVWGRKEIQSQTEAAPRVQTPNDLK